MINRNMEAEVFEKIVPMTTAERELVKKWMDEGNSPFSNPYGLVNLDGGSMLNFIQALNEFQFLDLNGGNNGKRYGMAEIIQVKELVVEGWENPTEGMRRARI